MQWLAISTLSELSTIIINIIMPIPYIAAQTSKISFLLGRICMLRICIFEIIIHFKYTEKACICISNNHTSTPSL